MAMLMARPLPDDALTLLQKDTDGHRRGEEEVWPAGAALTINS